MAAQELDDLQKNSNKSYSICSRSIIEESQSAMQHRRKFWRTNMRRRFRIINNQYVTFCYFYIVMNAIQSVSGKAYDRSRELLPDKGESSSTSSSFNHTGCLSMTTEQLESAWVFPGKMPDCPGGISDNSYTSSYYYDGDDDDYLIYTSVKSYYENFDSSDCTTFSNVWLWDLALSCDDVSTLEGCECTFAEEFYSQGLVSCAATSSSTDACPEDCSICQTCMTMVGCNNVYGSNQSGWMTYLPYMIASFLGVGVSAIIVFFGRDSRIRRATRGNSKFRANRSSKEVAIMENRDKTDQNSKQVWLAPVLI